MQACRSGLQIRACCFLSDIHWPPCLPAGPLLASRVPRGTCSLRVRDAAICMNFEGSWSQVMVLDFTKKRLLASQPGDITMVVKDRSDHGTR
jgi:hypothetical protein